MLNALSAANIKTAYESNADTNAFTDALQTKLNTTDIFDESGTYANLRAQATTAADVGLGNVTNESKATMFTDPTFTGTVSGVTKAHVGLGNVENYGIATKEEAEAGSSTEKYMTPARTKDAILELSPPTDLTAVNSHIADTTIHFTQAQISITESQISDFGTYEPADATILKSADIGVTVQGYDANTVIDANYETFDSTATYANLRAQATTAGDVGLGNVTNESKATMFTSPTFTGTPIAPTAAPATNTTQIATTAFVQQELAVIDGGEFN